MLSTARSFTCLRVSVAAGAALALALMLPAFVASGASVTYNNPNCASFTTSTTGSPPVLTVTCAGGGGGGGGGGAGTCTLTANPSSPAVNTSTVVTAACPGQPTSYVWTGRGCSAVTTASCTVTSNRVGHLTFNVTASTGAQGTIIVTWQ